MTTRRTTTTTLIIPWPLVVPTEAQLPTNQPTKFYFLPFFPQGLPRWRLGWKQRCSSHLSLQGSGPGEERQTGQEGQGDHQRKGVQSKEKNHTSVGHVINANSPSFCSWVWPTVLWSVSPKSHGTKEGLPSIFSGLLLEWIGQRGGCCCSYSAFDISLPSFSNSTRNLLKV